MESTNKAGGSATRPAHIIIPPRTLPSQLEDSSPSYYDGRTVPFSPTSPGRRSPGRPRTMKEYEEDLVNLKKENFNLKVRIYFMEQSRFDSNLPKDIDELRTSFTDLKVEYELTKKDLASKEDLLLNTYRALDVQKQQLDAMKAEHEDEKLQLTNKIESLEKELKEYHLKFMETSVQLDDTNAMYAITFGLDKKALQKEEAKITEGKVQELENELAKEKERVLMLEEMVVGYNEKSTSDQQYLVQLREEIVAVEEKLIKAVKEKEVFEKTVKEVAHHRAKLEKSIYKKDQIVKQKEGEIQALTINMNELEKELVAIKTKLQEKGDRTAQAHTQSLVVENSRLKQEVKFLHQQLESRSTPRTLRERSSSRRSAEEKEQTRLLREAQTRVEELQKEIEDLKNNKSRYHPSSVEVLIQTLIKEKKVLAKEVEKCKSHFRPSGSHKDSSKEEIDRSIDELKKEMTTEKDIMILELKQKIEELTSVINEKECRLQEYKSKSDATSPSKIDCLQSKAEDIKILEDSVCKLEREKDLLSRELNEQNREVVNLKKELKKRTYNLQGLVNTELWDKNREIEKLNKVCERQQLEVLSLQKQLRELQLTLVQEKVTSFVSGGRFVEDKENLQPIADPAIQLQRLTEDNKLLTRKVEELQARLLNTPERDTESLLVQTLRAERDQADKLRKDAVNACMLLTTRLQELADFLDSLLPSLCGKKRKVVQQAVERSRELSKSLSIAAEESTLHCSAWTDLQPSLYIPLLPDISTVDFWSGDECQEETFSGGEEVARLKSQVETLTEEVKQKDGEIARFQSEKNFSESLLMKSVFDFNEKNVLNNVENNNRVLGESTFGEYIADITEGSLVETSDLNNVDRSQTAEVKSANIGKITLTSKKKEPNMAHISGTFEETRQKEKDGSEYETWSEPDRDVSYARMGLKEDAASVNKSSQNFDDTSGTADSPARSPSSRRASEIQRLQRKIRSLEQVNEALRSELVILHQLAPPALTRQDKATSIELSRQSLHCVPSHLLEEIRNQREKLEASLFHNDYIRRQLESTVSSLRKNQGDDQEKATFLMEFAKNIPDHAKLSIPLIVKSWQNSDTWATPLTIAILHGNCHLCELLLEDGGDLHGNLERERPLTVALQSKQSDIVELLIRFGANVNLLENDGNSYPMYWAIRENNPPYIIEKIISAGFSASGLVLREERLSALQWAIQINNLEALEVLLKHSVDVNTVDCHGFTALSTAVELNRPNMVKLLVKYGAQLNNRKVIMSPLIIAIIHRNLTMAKVLLYLGVSIDEAWLNKDTYHPLNFALILFSFEIAMLLIAKGANVKARDAVFSCETALHLAAHPTNEEKVKASQVNIAKALIERGADINAKGKHDRTPLDVAINSKNTELCKLLLLEGANITGTAKIRGNGACVNRFDYILHESTFISLEFVKLCLERGGDYNYRDNHGGTSYHYILAKHNSTVVKLFWQYGCPYDQYKKITRKLDAVQWRINQENKRILRIQEVYMEGIEKNDLELVLNALLKGAESKGCSVKIPSTLHYVAANGNYKILRVLLENGVPVSRINKKGQTPLYIAVQKNHIQACLALLQFGACYNYLGSPAASTVNNLVKKHRRIYDLFKKVSNCFRQVKYGNCEVLSVLEQCVESKDTDLLLALMNCVNKKGHTLMGVALSMGHTELASKLMKLRLETTEPAVCRPYTSSIVLSYRK